MKRFKSKLAAGLTVIMTLAMVCGFSATTMAAETTDTSTYPVYFGISLKNGEVAETGVSQGERADYCHLNTNYKKTHTFTLKEYSKIHSSILGNATAHEAILENVVGQAPTLEDFIKYPSGKDTLKLANLEEYKADPAKFLETYYVRWYVLKISGKEWHVDGVLTKKGEVLVNDKSSVIIIDSNNQSITYQEYLDANTDLVPETPAQDETPAQPAAEAKEETPAQPAAEVKEEAPAEPVAQKQEVVAEAKEETPAQPVVENIAKEEVATPAESNDAQVAAPQVETQNKEAAVASGNEEMSVLGQEYTSLKVSNSGQSVKSANAGVSANVNAETNVESAAADFPVFAIVILGMSLLALYAVICRKGNN